MATFDVVGAGSLTGIDIVGTAAYNIPTPGIVFDVVGIMLDPDPDPGSGGPIVPTTGQIWPRGG